MKNRFTLSAFTAFLLLVGHALAVDSTPPTITAPGGGFTPLTLQTYLGGTATLPDYTAQPVTSDNVGVTSVTQSPAAGSAQSVGTTHITLTAFDAAGNNASIAFDVTVTVAQNQTLYDDSLINGWTNASAITNVSNSTPAHGGTHSISVVATSGFTGTTFYHSNAFNPSAYQSLSFWVYPTISGTNTMIVSGYLNSVGQPSVKLSFTSGQVNQWQHITLSLASLGVANNPAFNAFYFGNNTSGAQTFYLDDISLVATATPSVVAVSVDAQIVTGTIDRRIHGLNLEFGSPNVTGSAADAQTPSLLAETGIDAVRIMGGNQSSRYEWQTGVGNGNGFVFNDTSVTWGRLAEGQGVSASAYVNANYGSGTPEQAAAWVAYYNASINNTMALGTDSRGRDWKTAGYWATIRASAPLAVDDGYNFLRASHPAPFGLKNWEIGNECYGTWQYDQHGVTGSGLTGVAYDPYTYAQAFALFYSKMLAVDPTVRIGAVAVVGEDAYGIGTHAVANPNEGNTLHTGWTPVMLATLAGLGVTPHFLIQHSYPQGNQNLESDPWLLQAGASTQATSAANLRKMINDYFGVSSGAGIELSITEINCNGTTGKQSSNLVNALYYADTLGNLPQTEFKTCLWFLLKDNLGTRTITDTWVYGSRNYADFGLVGSGDIPGVPANTRFPTFYAVKLLKSWGRGGDSVVSATSNFPLLSVYTAKLQSGDLALLVINKHPTDDLNTQITLNNFIPGSTTAAVTSYNKSNDLLNLDLATSAATVSGSTINYTFPSYSMSVVVAQAQPQAAAPSVTLAQASAVATTTATFQGTVNPMGLATTAQFEFGPTTSYGGTASVTLSPAAGPIMQNVTVGGTALLPDTVYHYRLTASNSLGTTSTADATFATASGGVITSIPVFTTQPQSQTAALSRGAQLTCAANGTAAIAYQWYFNSTALSDGTSVTGSATATLTLANLLPANQGNYTVVATNVAGSTTSNIAYLTVDTSPPSGIVAIDPFADGSVTNLFGGDLLGLVYYASQPATATVVDDSAGIGTGNALQVSSTTIAGRVFAQFNDVTLANADDYVQTQYDIRYIQQPDNGGYNLRLGIYNGPASNPPSSVTNRSADVGYGCYTNPGASSSGSMGIFREGAGDDILSGFSGGGAIVSLSSAGTSFNMGTTKHTVRERITRQANGDLVIVATIDSTSVSFTHPAAAVLSYTFNVFGVGNSGSSLVTFAIDNVTVTTNPDTTPPMIAAPGGGFAPLTLATGVGSTIPLPDYTAQAVTTDNVAVANVTQSPAAGSPQSLGTKHLTLTAHDIAGNTASTSFDVVITDGTAPVITVIGANPASVAAEGVYSDAGATALDDISGNVAVTVSGTVNTGQTGAYTLTYSARDVAGNIGTATRIVNVTSTTHYAWKQNAFGAQANNAAIAGDLADPNHNGIPNLVEYALNGDASGNTSGIGILPAPSLNASGRLQVAFTRYLDRTDLTLIVQGANSPAGPWTTLATSTAGAGFTVVATGATVDENGTGNTRLVKVGDASATHVRRFMHLQVTRP